jgi:hypothetical protein
VRRHEIDPVSLVAGLLFLIVAGVHIAARSTDTHLSVRWMVPTVLVLLGVLGLLSAVRGPHGERQVSAAAGPATTVDRSDRGMTVDDASTVDEADEVNKADDATTIDEADEVSKVEAADETATDR